MENEKVRKIVVKSPIKPKLKPKPTKHQIAMQQEKNYLDQHIQKIVSLLQENLYYPRSARKRGITGEVIVKFTLLKDATAQYIEVTSSNSKILSKAAIKTIKNLSGEFPKPQEKLIIHVPIKYQLRR